MRAHACNYGENEVRAVCIVIANRGGIGHEEFL